MQDATEVPLWSRDGLRAEVALVDAADAPQVLRYRWTLNAGYARRYEQGGSVLMHRELLGLVPGDGLQADHVNRNRLDNRRSNLRVVTHAENMQNTPARSHGRSRFRGVYWDRSRSRWIAVCRFEGRKIKVGRYLTELDAARAADAWRLANMPFAQPDPALMEMGS